MIDAGVFRLAALPVQADSEYAVEEIYRAMWATEHQIDGADGED